MLDRKHGQCQGLVHIHNTVQSRAGWLLRMSLESSWITVRRRCVWFQHVRLREGKLRKELCLSNLRGGCCCRESRPASLSAELVQTEPHHTLFSPRDDKSLHHSLVITETHLSPLSTHRDSNHVPLSFSPPPPLSFVLHSPSQTKDPVGVR